MHAACLFWRKMYSFSHAALFVCSGFKFRTFRVVSENKLLYFVFIEGRRSGEISDKFHGSCPESAQKPW